MKKIYVTTAFNYNDGKEIKPFSVGFHDVEKEVAEHWFVKAHCSPEGPTQQTDGVDTRITELESVVSGKDKVISELEEKLKVVAEKDTRITELESEVKALTEKVATLSKANSDGKK